MESNSVTENRDEEQVIEVFPKPPAFIYKKFETGPNALLPPDLKQIKAKNTTYCFFGEVLRFDFTEPTLDSFGVEQLFDPAELPKKYQETLEKQAFSLLESSLQLLTFWRQNPSGAHLKVEDLRLISNNMFYLLNNLRRKQSLIYLEAKVRHEIKKRKEAREKIMSRIKSLSNLVSS